MHKFVGIYFFPCPFHVYWSLHTKLQKQFAMHLPKTGGLESNRFNLIFILTTVPQIGY